MWLEDARVKLKKGELTVSSELKFLKKVPFRDSRPHLNKFCFSSKILLELLRRLNSVANSKVYDLRKYSLFTPIFCLLDFHA